MMASGAVSRSSQYWRHAASLVLVAPSSKPVVCNSRTCDLDVLMVKRGQGSSFLPNAYVYPGGVVSPADFDRTGWTKVFSRLKGFSDLSHLLKPFSIPGVRPPMMTDDLYDEGALPPEIAFRLGAIRETFEETGVLLVCDPDDVTLTEQMERIKGNVPEMTPMKDSFDKKEWQTRIVNDASELQRLCSDFSVVPNIWALYEWSNWLTPVMFRITKPPKKPNRFDTIFFICCLKNVYETELFTDEITKVEWKSPLEWQKLAKDKTVTFVGPQIIETSRLASFSNISECHQHVCQREPLGCVRWMPVFYKCTDGMLSVLPGDEWYPENPDYEGTKELLETDKSIMEACLGAERLHRVLLSEREYYVNVNDPNGHVPLCFAPRTFPKDSNVDHISKL